MYTSVRYSREQSGDWKKHGSFSAKLTKTDGTNLGYTWHRRGISGYPVGTPFTVSAVVYVPAGSWYIGKLFTMRIRQLRSVPIPCSRVRTSLRQPVYLILHNIETITKAGQTIRYYYDELNQVTREDNAVLNKTITPIQPAYWVHPHAQLTTPMATPTGKTNLPPTTAKQSPMQTGHWWNSSCGMRKGMRPQSARSSTLITTN